MSLSINLCLKNNQNRAFSQNLKILDFFPICSIFSDKVVVHQWIMHQNISMKVVHDSQMQLPHIIVNYSSIDHLSDPSPLKFPQISRKYKKYKPIQYNTIASIQGFGILDQRGCSKESMYLTPWVRETWKNIFCSRNLSKLFSLIQQGSKF